MEMLNDYQKLAVIPAILAVSACGGGGGKGDATSFDLANVRTISEINAPTQVLSYDVIQGGKQSSGYVVTNNTAEFTAGTYEPLASGDVEVLSTQTATSTSFVGTVRVSGEEYLAYVYEIGENEILMALPPEYTANGWTSGSDVAFPDNAIIRSVGATASPVNITGNATYSGKLFVVGGGGKENLSATLDVNFDNNTGRFESNVGHFTNGSVSANVVIDASTGEFSSNDLKRTFDAGSNPDTVTGELQGNFTGDNQNGAIGAIWSDAGQDQFKGTFALTR